MKMFAIAIYNQDFDEMKVGDVVVQEPTPTATRRVKLTKRPVVLGYGSIKNKITLLANSEEEAIVKAKEINNDILQS